MSVYETVEITYTETVMVEYIDWGEYAYFATFVVSFGNRMVPTNDRDVIVNRIWADGEVIYDQARGYTMPGISFTFYPGTEDQIIAPDDVAYRGQMVLVFHDMPLEEFGNRIPSVSIEVTDEVATDSHFGEVARMLNRKIDVIGVLPEANRLIGLEAVKTREGQYANDPDYDLTLSVFSLTGKGELFTYKLPGQYSLYNDQGYEDTLRVLKSRGLVISKAYTLVDFGYRVTYYVFNALTGQYNGEYQTGEYIPDNGYKQYNTIPVGNELVVYDDNGQAHIYTVETETDVTGGGEVIHPSICLVDDSGITPLRGPEGPFRHSGAFGTGFPNWSTPGNQRPGESDMLFVLGQRTNNVSLRASKQLVRLTVGIPGSDPMDPTEYQDLPDDEWPVAPELRPTAVWQDVYTAPETFANIVFAQYMADGHILLYMYRASSVFIVRKITYDGTHVWDSDPIAMPSWIYAGFAATADPVVNEWLFLDADPFALGNANQRLAYMLNTITGDTYQIEKPDELRSVRTISLNPFVQDISTGPYWDYRTSTSYIRNTENQIMWYRPRVAVGGAISLASALDQLAQRAGYEPGQVEITGLDQITFDGFIIGSNESLATVTHVLNTIYDFNYTDVDGVFTARSSYVDGALTIDTTVAPEELATLSETGNQTIVSNIADAMQAPVAVTVTYFDIDNNYEPNTQIAQRPYEVTDATGVTNISLPLSLTAEDALNLAYDTLYRLWGYQNSHSVRLSRKHVPTVPGDILTLLANGVQITGMATDVTVNADHSVSLSLAERALSVPIVPPATSRQPQAPLPVAPGGDPRPSINPAEISLARPVVFDIPVTTGNLQRVDDLFLQVGAQAMRGEYQKATLRGGQITGPNYARDVANLPTETPFGVVVDHETFTTNPLETDYLSHIVIDRQRIPLERFQQATYEEMLEGANEAVVGFQGRAEILRFGNVEVLDDRHVRLTMFFRGRYGTEGNVNSIRVGDYFAFHSDLHAVQLPNEWYEAALPFGYSTVVEGQPKWDIVENRMALLANSRKPLAPTDIRAKIESNGDIRIEWKRRSRVHAPLHDGNMREGSNLVPLDEEYEAYTLDIYAPGWGTVRRQVVNIYRPFYVYRYYEQANDGFGSDPVEIENVDRRHTPDLHIAVYQVSPAVGRGFPGGGRIRVSGPFRGLSNSLAAHAEVSMLATVDLTAGTPSLAAHALVTADPVAHMKQGHALVAPAVGLVQARANLRVTPA